MPRNEKRNGTHNPAIRLIAALLGLSVSGINTRPAVAQDFDLAWFTIDGGGAMFTHGGAFELSGTIGQIDAGEAMTGGNFALTGGFWTADHSAPCLGDLNGSGTVDLGDLANLLAHFGCPAGCTLQDGDLNGNGDVALEDLTILLSRFGTVCP